jgi:peptidoglycan/LPS O-acetylase OafA/YrhL
MVILGHTWCIIAACAVASLCSYLIERPFLTIKRRFGGAGAAAPPSAPRPSSPIPPRSRNEFALVHRNYRTRR